ncbi:molybdate ABC transporter substrate-binding protein [Spirulina sp. CS-785/01]|uniref:molybdate ABC transporter substrate-binding protein n=1 Tax=Spirulina sp. CS-785/01 TaxID=3021716 RepID=UPI0023311DC7|nr:molybdate ABC transporter substrate-binding protein [Spirulina sp. CS-785/01]MDB9311714.1 molybdate ABC transporter substrate-binding protein [Spirulina sp. CS-785/01]
MMKRRHFLSFSAWMILAFSVVACSAGQANQSEVNYDTKLYDTKLTVSVAASVQDAMQEIKTAYQAKNPDVAITYNFGSSGSLAQQIHQGAPVDVFLSASPKWMDDLEEKGQILTETRQNLLENSLVLIVARNKEEVRGFKELKTETVSYVAMGEPESVPAGQYAQEVLMSLGLFPSLESKLVFGKDVRQVLAYVETGNVDAGLVYGTDAQISESVKVVATAASDTHAPIRYPVAVVRESLSPGVAQEFINFLSTEAAIAIFEDYGFSIIN